MYNKSAVKYFFMNPPSLKYICFVFLLISICKIKAQFPNPVFFNTATNATATGTIPVGTNDLNWTAALTNSLGPYVPAVSCGNIAPGNWATSPFPNANWITYPHTCSSNVAEHSCLGSIDEFYRLIVNLPATSCGQSVSTPSAYCLSLDFFADNWINEVFVNGVSNFFNPTGNPYNSWGFLQNNGMSVSLCNNWQVGSNTVIVHVKSGAPSFPGYAGFLAQVNQTLNPTFNNPVSANVTSTNVLCNGGNNGTASVTASGGNGTYSYTWLPTGGNSSLASNLPSGIYTVAVSSGTYCVVTNTVNITQPPPVILSVSSNTSICNGSSITLTVSGANSYQWSTGSTASSITVNSSGVYSVTGTVNGCSQTQTVSVSIGTTPTLGISGSNTICLGAAVTLTAQGATTYTWNTGVVSPVLNITPLVSTVYTVTGSNLSNTCVNTETFSVLVYQTPSVAISGNLLICGQGTVNLQAAGANSYSWSTGAVGSLINVNPAATTSYSVTGADAVSGCTNNANTTVTVSPMPQLSVNGGTACAGHSITLSASGGNSYAWSTGTQSNTIVVSPVSNTTYTVTAFGTSTLCSVSQTVPVLILTAPQLTINNSPPICRGQSAQLVVSGFNSYYWSTGDTASSINVSPVVTTIYSVTSVEKATGCISSKTVQVTVNDLPKVNITGDTALCDGEKVVLKASGANQYQWSNGITNPTLTTVVNENQLFLLIGTDTQTGCSNVDSVRLGNSPKCCDIYIPNSFTPNGDGVNEGFSAKSECKFKEFKMYIFDKWGEEIFSSNDITQPWNGYYKGKLCQQDIYVYLIRAERGGIITGIKPVYEKTGHVSLIR